jgi:hypothetical protein
MWYLVFMYCVQFGIGFNVCVGSWNLKVVNKWNAKDERLCML